MAHPAVAASLMAAEPLDSPASMLVVTSGGRFVRHERPIRHVWVPTSLDRAVRRAPLFEGADEATVDLLVREMEQLHAVRGTVLSRQDGPGHHLYIVLSGKVKLTQRYPGGRERVLALLGPTEQFGELRLIGQGSGIATAMAVSDTRLARLHETALARCMSERPDMAVQMLRVLSHQLRRAHDEVAGMVFNDVGARLAKTLLDFARRFGLPAAQGVEIAHHLTQAELAQMVGTSRETLNKTLARFTARGWIRVTASGSVVITDSGGLSRRAR